MRSIWFNGLSDYAAEIEIKCLEMYLSEDVLKYR